MFIKTKKNAAFSVLCVWLYCSGHLMHLIDGAATASASSVALYLPYQGLYDAKTGLLTRDHKIGGSGSHLV